MQRYAFILFFFPPFPPFFPLFFPSVFCLVFFFFFFFFFLRNTQRDATRRESNDFAFPGIVSFLRCCQAPTLSSRAQYTVYVTAEMLRGQSSAGFSLSLSLSPSLSFLFPFLFFSFFNVFLYAPRAMIARTRIIRERGRK
jgi:hypothetical protein